MVPTISFWKYQTNVSICVFGGPGVATIDSSNDLSTDSVVKAIKPGLDESVLNAINNYKCDDDEHNGYIVMKGTSMAAPYVAGIIGELHDRYPQYRRNPKATKRIILTTATDLGAPGVDAEYGYGLVNRNKAVLTIGKTIHKPPVVVPDRKAPHVPIRGDRFAMQFV